MAVRTPQAALVGRSRELEALDEALRRGSRGASVVVLEGAAGMGKSTLLGRLAARGREEGFAVVEGRAAEFERSVPFALAVDALDDPSADARLERLGEERLADLAAVLPSVAGTAAAAPLAGPLDRPRYHRAIRSALELLAPGRPLLLSLDDVHWADEASVELILHLLRRPPRVAHLLALALRPGEVESRVVAALRDVPDALHLSLPALSDEAALELLRDVPDAAARSALVAEGAGNPFFLRELAAVRSAAGAASSRPAPQGEIPPVVAAAIAVELGRLPEPARALARGAAVAGEPFDPEVAAAAAGVEPDATLAALDALRAADLVRPAGSPRDFAFRHAVVRRAVYEDAPPGWRLGAHARVADALEARGAPAGVRAHHVEVVARPGDADAGALLAAAGDEALTRDPHTAARWYEAALRLGGPERGSLLVRLARAQAGTGDLDTARDTLLTALAELDPADVAAHTGLSLVCAGIEHLLGHTNAAYDRLLAALARVPEDEVELRAALEVELAINAKYRVGAEDLTSLTEHALASARALGNRVLLASVAAVHAVNCFHAGRFEEAVALRAEAEQAIAATADLELAAWLDAVYHVALAATVMDELAIGEAVSDRGIRIGRATGQDQLLVPLLVFKAMALHQWGRITEAVAITEEAEDSARVGGAAHMLHWALWMRAAIAEASGDLELAIRLGEESVRVAAHLDRGTIVTLGRANLAAMRVHAGDPDRARRELLEAGGEDFDVGEPSWSCHLLAMLVRAQIEAGDLEAAERWATVVEERAAVLGAPIPRGRAACARAQVLIARGEPERAAELVERAAREARDAGARLNAWQADLIAGRALTAAGRRDEAVAVLRAVAQEAGAQGAGLYRSYAERELRSLGERIGRGGRRAPAGGEGLDALSERERQIAGKVAEGLTNREIGAALFLAEKTVEAHLSRIYAKVGVRSRVDLARLVAEHAASHPD